MRLLCLALDSLVSAAVLVAHKCQSPQSPSPDISMDSVQCLSLQQAPDKELLSSLLDLTIRDVSREMNHSKPSQAFTATALQKVASFTGIMTPSEELSDTSTPLPDRGRPLFCTSKA